MKVKKLRPWALIMEGLLILSGTSILLYAARVIAVGNWRYWYLVWNLGLAWIPLLCALWLRFWLRRGKWLSWQGIGISFAWLIFLPNSFYLVSDFVHLSPTGEIGLLFDTVLLMAFAFTGLLLGYAAVHVVHSELIRRLGRLPSMLIVLLVFLLSGFAIYLGRYMAWNSWDIVANPTGLLFDVSDRLINPGRYTNTYTTTLMFFVLISGLYTGVGRFIRGFQAPSE